MKKIDETKFNDLSGIIQSIFTLGECSTLKGAILTQEDICEYVNQILEVFDCNSNLE